MLRYFPVAYDDELLYSQIARYHRHTCSPGFKQTVSELFGSRTVAGVVDLPAHLERLHENIGHITNQSADSMLYQHTLLPVFEPFLGNGLARKVKASMLSDYGGDIHTRAGLSASSVKRPAYLRVCPECLSSQYQQSGETYWQRLFQITGVLVCPVHECLLQTTLTPYVPTNKHQFMVAPFSIHRQDSGSDSGAEMTRLVLVAKDFQHLLQHNYQSVNHVDWSRRYKRLLIDKQIARGSSVNQIELASGFTAFWGKGLLRAVSSSVSAGEDHTWLSAMARKHRKNIHPIRHILLYRYLAGVDAPLSDLFNIPTVTEHSETSVIQNKPLSNAALKDREHWLKFQGEHPDLHAKALRLLEPALYARLYRQDKVRLQSHTPHQQESASINKRVNWPRRDRSLARQIIRQARVLKAKENRPRCSIKQLLKIIGCSSMAEKYLTKLPVSRRALQKYAESVIEYQCRRIDWAVSQMHQNQEPVLSWKVYRKANIRADVSQEVHNYLKGKADESVNSGTLSPAPQG